MKNILLISLLVFSFGCTNNSDQFKLIDNIKIIESEVLPIIQNFTLDSFTLKSNRYAGDGFCVMNNDSLYLVDPVFSIITTYDLKGDIYSEHLGKKTSYNLQSLASLSFSNNGNLIISDKFKFLRFSKDWKFLDSSYLIYQKSIDNNQLLNHPNAAYPDLYEIKYNQFSYPNKGRYLIVEVESEHPKFNGFTNKNYYQTARNLALIDPNTWRVKPVFGSWPKTYKTGKNFPYFANLNYQYKNEQFYITYEIDSLIYVFNKRYVPIYAFGKNGQIVNKNYTPSISIENAFDENLRFKERNERGYYDFLFVDDKGEFIFRSYFTGLKMSKNLHRLQIYMKTKLLRDIIIPKKFRPIGYNSSFLYAEGGEHNNEKIIYKVKIGDI
jgi:hypothetical protein